MLLYLIRLMYCYKCPLTLTHAACARTPNARANLWPRLRGRGGLMTGMNLDVTQNGLNGFRLL